MATKQDNTNSEEPCRAADDSATVNAQWNKAAAHPGRPSLYIHIPFCLSKCPYCSFSSQPGLESLFPRYLAALLREAATVATAHPTPPLTTLFLGGGTPTILEGRQLVTIVDTCRELFGFAKDVELSIEANPGTVDPEKLCLLRAGGFNRLSVGVQSLNNLELTRLGRAHSAKDAEAAVLAARAAGFDNISLDLMYGLPGQDANSWQQSLERAITLAPDHLSLYELTIEQGTPFHSLLHNGQLGLPDEDEMAAMDQLTATLCRRAGFARYEISNYSRPDRRCRHNINYWQNGSYLALGAGAVACLNGRRHHKTSAIRSNTVSASSRANR